MPSRTNIRTSLQTKLLPPLTATPRPMPNTKRPQRMMAVEGFPSSNAVPIGAIATPVAHLTQETSEGAANHGRTQTGVPAATATLTDLPWPAVRFFPAIGLIACRFCVGGRDWLLPTSISAAGEPEEPREFVSDARLVSAAASRWSCHRFGIPASRAGSAP